MTEQTIATAVRAGMPDIYHPTLADDQYQALLHRLDQLEQEVAQIRDVLKSGWIPNPVYETAEYEHDPVTGAIWPRKS